MFAFGDVEWPGVGKLVEECGEFLQVAGRLVASHGDPRRWAGTDLVQDFLRELADVRAASQFAEDVLPAEASEVVRARAAQKLALFHGWHADGGVGVRPVPSAGATGAAAGAGRAGRVPGRGSAWSVERVADQYRAELRALFEAENAARRAEDEADAEACRRDHPRRWDDLVASGATSPRDSYLWEIYSTSDIQICGNRVRVTLPPDCSLGVDLLGVLERPSVCWTRAQAAAVIVDEGARVAVELVLVDAWDDERAAAAAARDSATTARGGG